MAVKLEEALQPDVIHLNCFAYGALPFSAPVVVVTHSDVLSWFLSVKGTPPPQEWERYYRCVKEGLKGADKVIAPSKAKRQMVKEIYSNENISVIYNGRDQTLFAPAAKEPFVFSMGRLWDEAKNIQLVADAAPFITAPVVMAGECRFEGNGANTTGTGIHYAGRLTPPQVAEQLSKAAVYVLPAKYEPFGLSVLEAALSGCALVLGDIPSLREIWQEAAVYVDTSNAGELATVVNQLFADKERLASFGRMARERALQFSAEKMAEQYRQTYRQLVMQKTKQKETV
jgi:glycosyltransferase involved in cell wall biosynthesis